MSESTGAEFYKSLSPDQTKGDYQKTRWDTNMGRAHFETTQKSIVTHAFPLARTMRRYLELGPGPGTWTKLFVETHPDASLTLVDISEEMLGQAKRELNSDTIEYVLSDFREYEGHTGAVDFFFSSRAIEYIEDKSMVAGKVSSLLKEGGKGFIITKCGHPVRDSLRGRKLPERHAHQTTPRAFIRELQKAGLKVTSFGIAAVTVPLVHNPALNTLVWKIAQFLPAALQPYVFAESFWVAFEKPSARA